MTIDTFVESNADRFGLKKAVLRRIINAYTYSLAFDIHAGKRVRIPKVGTVFLSVVPERVHNNTLTKGPITTPAHRRAKFRPTKALKNVPILK